eukprot:m.166042 g.166042  ORF g.166042 m.166042 type:complete len:854 (-) comp31412_c0_seq2:421-2982(-)
MSSRSMHTKSGIMSRSASSASRGKGSSVRSSRNNSAVDRYQSVNFDVANEEPIQLMLLDANENDISHKLPRSLVNPEVRLDQQINQPTKQHLGSRSANGLPFASSAKISSTMLLGGGNAANTTLDDVSMGFPLKSIMQRTSSVLESPLLSRSRVNLSAADSNDSIPGGGNLGDFGRTLTDAVAGISDVTTVRHHLEVEEEVDEASLDKPVSLELNESEMIWMYDSHGSFVADDGEFAEDVKTNNQRYTEYKAKTEGSRDWLSDRYSQTLHGRPKHKDTQMTAAGKQSIACEVSESSIHDAFVQLREQEAKANRAVSAYARKTTKFDSAAKTRIFPDTMKAIDEKRGALWSGALQTTSSTIFEETRLTPTPGIMVVDDEASENKVVDALAFVENKEQLLAISNLPSFVSKLHTLERLVLNSSAKFSLGQHEFCSSQHDDQDLLDKFDIVKAALAVDVENAKPPVVEGEEENEKEEKEKVDPDAPYLDTLWEFSSELTQGRKVLCTTWNKTDGNILAAGYASTPDKPTAIVCAWSYKNPKHPDRLYELPSTPCSVSFSTKWAGLLGVGLENGEVYVFDVGSPNTEPVCTSKPLDVIYRHNQPVWGLTWVSQAQESTSELKDILVSACMGGSVRKWDLKTKGFVSSELMAVNRATSKEPRVTSNAKSNHTAYLKKEGSCMSLSFYPQDPLMYLIGSEDGVVYKCSCSYSEQSLDTFVGHSGPVYAIKWSPFTPNVFLTCSADWTLRIWDEKTNTTLKVLQPSTTAVTDCAWSPRTPTVLAAVSNSGLAIWDLGVKDFDPIITLSSKTLKACPTTVLFSNTANAVTYGDDQGRIFVSMLCNMPNVDTDLVTVLTKVF